ncbi:unnamed protein product, partial [Discosporangium mesarthrocarpum]
NRLEIYSYWNQGGAENVLSLFLTLGDRYLLPTGVAPPPGSLQETPALALWHPLLDVTQEGGRGGGGKSRFLATPAEYLRWYEQ